MKLWPGWRIILEQLGVAYEVIRRWDGVTPERFSAIIVNDIPDSTEMEVLDAYMREGGGVLDAAAWLPAVEPAMIGNRGIGAMVPAADDDLFRHIWLADLDTRVKLHREATWMGGAVYLGDRGGGAIACLAFDPGTLLRDVRSVRRQFHAPASPYPNEIVARVSKGEIRRIVEAALRWLHARRGLPYVHRWHFPGRLPCIFCCRIDSDYGTREQVESLHAVARDHDIAMTWFLHAEVHAGWLERFAAMDDQEMALHGYRHRTFRSYEENRANIAAAAALLEREGIPFTGFAAPNGFWNVSLARAVADAGLVYTSEFSLDYDDLPFHPELYGDSSPVLQVPIHPICIGSLARVKAGAAVMKEYFRGVIDRGFRLREPVILYHHPGHEYWDVIADSFRCVRGFGIVNMTMGEYAAWWLRRERVRFEAWYDGDAIGARFRTAEPDVELAVRDAAGRYGFIARDGAHRYADIAWDAAPEPVAAPADIRKIRRWSPLLLRHSIEDCTSRARQ